MKVHQITFSPTGGTRKVCELICSSISKDCIVTELCLKVQNVVYPDITADDLVVIGMPVYGGRIPALAIERLKGIKANKAKCVVVAVYGNRAYDDALVEMQDVTIEMGFRVIAGIAAVAEHSIIRKYGAGRPDTDDTQMLKHFGEKISEKVVKDIVEPVTIPGNRPYKKAMAGPNPSANSKCNACGTCVSACPVDAISIDDIRKVNKHRCISCMRCVSVCPTNSRGIGGLMSFIIAQAIKKPCASRKENELFI